MTLTVVALTTPVAWLSQDASPSKKTLASCLKCLGRLFGRLLCATVARRLTSSPEHHTNQAALCPSISTYHPAMGVWRLRDTGTEEKSVLLRGQSLKSLRSKNNQKTSRLANASLLWREELIAGMTTPLVGQWLGAVSLINITLPCVFLALRSLHSHHRIWLLQQRCVSGKRDIVLPVLG